MTAADLQVPPDSAPGGQSGRPRLARTAAGLRLVLLHLASRRVPGALAGLALCGGLLRAALYWRWTLGKAGATQQVPVLIEAGAAALIAVTTFSPFGEPERATGRWLPCLRLATAVVLTGAAVGALAAGAAAAGLPGGTLDLLRNVAGLTGVGLLVAAVTGGLLAWTGPLTYMVVAEFAITGNWATPWMWPAQPPPDRGAAICAALVFAAGLVVTTVRGARDPAPV